jgi:hypothetical protein
LKQKPSFEITLSLSDFMFQNGQQNLFSSFEHDHILDNDRHLLKHSTIDI